jgi:hypothetical protein
MSPRDRILKLVGKVYIVKAPMVLRRNISELTYGEMVNGKYHEPDLSKYDIFGMTLEDLADYNSQGYRIYLYDKRDLSKLYDACAELVGLLEDSHRRINNRMTEDMYSVSENLTMFANTVMKLNRSKLSVSVSIKEMTHSLGFISEDEMKKRMEYKKIVSPKQKRINEIRKRMG